MANRPLLIILGDTRKLSVYCSNKRFDWLFFFWVASSISHPWTAAHFLKNEHSSFVNGRYDSCTATNRLTQVAKLQNNSWKDHFPRNFAETLPRKRIRRNSTTFGFLENQNKAIKSTLGKIVISRSWVEVCSNWGKDKSKLKTWCFLSSCFLILLNSETLPPKLHILTTSICCSYKKQWFCDSSWRSKGQCKNYEN